MAAGPEAGACRSATAFGARQWVKWRLEQSGSRLGHACWHCLGFWSSQGLGWGIIIIIIIIIIVTHIVIIFIIIIITHTRHNPHIDVINNN